MAVNMGMAASVLGERKSKHGRARTWPAYAASLATRTRRERGTKWEVRPSARYEY